MTRSSYDKTDASHIIMEHPLITEDPRESVCSRLLQIFYCLAITRQPPQMVPPTRSNLPNLEGKTQNVVSAIDASYGSTGNTINLENSLRHRAPSPKPKDAKNPNTVRYDEECGYESDGPIWF